MMQELNDAPVIFAYTLRQAIDDGVLVEVFSDAWDELSGGKPIVATAAVADAYANAALVEIWNRFVTWRRWVEPTLPEEDRLFATEINGETIWVLEDGQAVTILSLEDH